MSSSTRRRRRSPQSKLSHAHICLYFFSVDAVRLLFRLTRIKSQYNLHLRAQWAHLLTFVDSGEKKAGVRAQDEITVALPHLRRSSFFIVQTTAINPNVEEWTITHKAQRHELIIHDSSHFQLSDRRVPINSRAKTFKKRRKTHQISTRNQAHTAVYQTSSPHKCHHEVPRIRWIELQDI